MKLFIIILSVSFSLTACNNETPNTARSAEEMLKINLDCGTTKEQTEAWFATHKTGWAEHVEAGVKCISEHS